MTYMVFDLETTSLGSVGGKKGLDPLNPDNRIIVVATKLAKTNPKTLYDSYSIPRNFDIDLSNVDMLVGHNIKYDLLYVWDNPNFKEFFKRGGTIFDTQLAYYLLTGQEGKWAKLDDLCELYLGEKKKDPQVVELFNSVGSDQIPKEILLPYAEGDVIYTEQVALILSKKLKAKGMLPVTRVYMDHLLALVSAEYNGLPLKRDLAQRYATKLERTVNRLRVEADKEFKALFPAEIEPNIKSNDHLSAAIFGGTLTYQKQEPILDAEGNQTYYSANCAKAGLPRMKLQKKEVYIKGLGLTPPSDRCNTKKDGVWKVDEGTLAKVQGDIPFLKKLMELREYSKIHQTYVVPFIQESSTDSRVHPNFNICQTDTSRLSSSQPNAQNISPKTLGLFTSRFEGGYVAEFDFSQLEVCIQAWLVQSPQFVKDIEEGVDFHTLRLSYLYPEMTYTEVKDLVETDKEWAKRRKEIAKPISFSKAYGKIPENIARDTGLSVDTVKKVFDAEDARYPEIKEFYASMKEQLQANRIWCQHLLKLKKPYAIWVDDDKLGKQVKKNVDTVDGEYASKFKYQSPTGLLLTVHESGVMTSRGTVFRYINEPTVMNYPIQSTAATLVSLAAGRVFRHLVTNNYKSLIICEVHDSIVLDVHPDEKDLIISEICAIMEDKSTWKKIFGIELNVPIKADVKVGRTWKEAK